MEPKALRLHKDRYGDYPEIYYQEPILPYAGYIIKDMFNELCTEKQTDYGRIPFSKIKAFCDYYKIVDFRRFLYIIRRLEDEVYEIMHADKD